MDLVFLNLFYPQSRWGGKLSLKNSSLSGNYGGALLSVKDINGTITIKDNVSSKNPLADVMGEHLKLSKSIFQKFLTSFKESNLKKEDLDFLTINEIKYGILTFDNVEVALEVDRDKINLRRLISKLFRGNIYGAGLLKFNSDQSNYNLSLLFNEISLEGISERLSPNQEYITGLLNGLLWLRGEGAELNTIDGPFKFWSKKSSKEPRNIGQALLDQLGARERLVLGSSRSYDNANISGYIKDGLMTFREFDVTNRVLGFKNLSIQADPVKNSITIEHLISVIRELARRSETGGPTIETN
ncbi:MAG: AsmA family protein [Thermodesulfobacteriota bacterium]